MVGQGPYNDPKNRSLISEGLARPCGFRRSPPSRGCEDSQQYIPGLAHKITLSRHLDMLKERQAGKAVRKKGKPGRKKGREGETETERKKGACPL